MSRRSRLYLQDIQTSCQKILRYTQDISFENFQADDRTFDAVAYNLQIIGEAVKNLPPALREQAPQIEWRKISGLRDILAHAYFQVDHEIIWDVVQTKIPPLQVALDSLLKVELDT